MARNAILGAITQLRMGLEEAAEHAKSFMTDHAAVDQVYAELKEKQKAHQVVRAAVLNPESYDGEGWYLGPSETGHWSRYEALLKHRREQGIEALGSETESIVGLLADPSHHGQKRKGLVMGNVQSGKTRNFAGVIAKAVDAGYKLVIVLSGINNNLREQTQARLTRDLFHVEGWYPLTDKERDFVPLPKPQELMVHQPALCAVVKKNPTRLKYLVKMMRAIPQEIRRLHPVLIVDDEADQATPNSLAERQRISTINRRLRELWASVESGSYVAYTATPFANVLMDPEDDEELFPSDFLTTIEPGDGYFGSDRVFGIAESVDEEDGAGSDGLDMVRRIPKEDSDALRPPSSKEARESFDPDLPGSLREAFAWFVVATAIRWARGDIGHSSMLVHTTHYTAPHFAMALRLRELVESARQEVAAGQLAAFAAAWQEESGRVSGAATAPLPVWSEVEQRLSAVLNDIEVIVDNGASADRLNYDDDRKHTVVAIGGGTLARGLTLEGLVVSYFTRTSNTYDTLMQMGRWFGYRPRYEDLPRVWVTDGLDADYAFLARVEQDLRAEIGSVQGSEFTPKEVGVKVRAHPGRLQVTAANKMFHASVVQLGLSGTANQTFILDGSDQGLTGRNVEAVAALIRGLQLTSSPGQTSSPMVRDVPGHRVVDFLREFRAHDSQSWLQDTDNRERLTEWVGKWAGGPLWNVILVDTPQKAGSNLGTLKIGEVELRCANRSALEDSTSDKINLKAIMSPDDRLRDIDPAVYRGDPHSSDEQRRRLRRLHGGGRGLILVYPISKNSAPKLEGGNRIALPVDHHLLGFVIFFPNVNDVNGEAGAFVSVRPMWEIPETVEGDEVLDQQEDGDDESGE